MNGTINFDVTNDKDLKEMCAWINAHQYLDLKTEFTGRYVIVEFKPKNEYKVGEA